MDHIDQAVYSTVHESKITAKEIAHRLGMSHQVLLNKANPQSEFHKLTLREALAIQLIIGNHRIHSALGAELGIQRGEGVPVKNLLEAVLATCREHGDVVREVQNSIEGDRFILREREQCHKEIDEAVLALFKLRETVVTYGEK